MTSHPSHREERRLADPVHSKELALSRTTAKQQGRRGPYESRENEAQEATFMSANDQEESYQTNLMKLRPHAKWANQLIALAQYQLSGTECDQLEAHLKKCVACTQAYLVYRGVASLIYDKVPPADHSGLPPKLQQVKDHLIAEDEEFAKRVAAAKPRQSAATRKQVTRDPSRELAEKKQPTKKREKASSKKAAAPVGAGVEDAGQQ